MNQKQMVDKFQCPGCVVGHNPKCGKYKFEEDYMKCTSHVLGTLMSGAGHIALGLPKGFCRPGWDNQDSRTRNKIDLRLWTNGTTPKWDNWNVAVWAMQKDGFLFVRTFAPRINMSWVDVIEGGTLEMVPNAINVAEFYDDMD